MEVKVKKCELNFKNTREKIVMEVAFQKTNEAVDIRDFLCMAMRDNPHLRVEFSKGEYRVTDKHTTASTNACAILEQLPAILQTFRTFNGEAEGQVPDKNSKQNDIEIKWDKEKGNFGGKDQGSQTHEEDKEIQGVSEKPNFGNKAHHSLIGSEIGEKTKETEIDKEAVNRANTSNYAYASQCREADDSYSKTEASKQEEDSHGFNTAQGKVIEKESLPHQESDNSQTAIISSSSSSSSYDGHPKAKGEMAGKEMQGEENASSSTDESKGNEEGKISKKDPNSSRSEAQQGEEKAHKPGACREMEISETSNTPDESIHTPKSDYSQAKPGTAPMQIDKNVGITKAQTTSGEASESEKEAAKCSRDPEPTGKVTCTGDPKSSCSGANQPKGKAGKSEDIKARDQSVSAISSSQEHEQSSISGTSEAKQGKAVMKNMENTSLLANAEDIERTKNNDTRPKEKLSLRGNNSNGTFV